MGKARRTVRRKTKKDRIHRPNKGPMWEVVDGKVVRTHKECPRCGSGVYLAKHYSRSSCGRCGYTKFDTPNKTGTKTIGGVKTSTRKKRQLKK